MRSRIVPVSFTAITLVPNVVSTTELIITIYWMNCLIAMSMIFNLHVH